MQLMAVLKLVWSRPSETRNTKINALTLAAAIAKALIKGTLLNAGDRIMNIASTKFHSGADVDMTRSFMLYQGCPNSIRCSVILRCMYASSAPQLLSRKRINKLQANTIQNATATVVRCFLNTRLLTAPR
jgi:hypothetical protein